jgi:thymidylate kinase
MAIFSVLTGLDGSGTSTIAKLLSEHDKKSKLYDSILVPFSNFREIIDSEILDNNIFSHFFFYLSALANTSELIKHDLDNGFNVYCIRYLIDTIVSHRVHGMDIELSYSICTYNFAKPDFIFFLEVDEQKRQERISTRSKGKNKLDKSLDDFVFRNKFLHEFARYDKEIIRISNNDTPKITLESIHSVINSKQ